MRRDGVLRLERSSKSTRKSRPDSPLSTLERKRPLGVPRRSPSGFSDRCCPDTIGWVITMLSLSSCPSPLSAETSPIIRAISVLGQPGSGVPARDQPEPGKIWRLRDFPSQALVIYLPTTPNLGWFRKRRMDACVYSLDRYRARCPPFPGPFIHSTRGFPNTPSRHV